MKSIRIGNGCGFWGDNVDAPLRLAETGNLHYLTLEYLAELTMSILALQKQRDPAKGYAGDFLDVLRRLTPVLSAQPQLKIITNAGGMNPLECARMAREILAEAGLPHLRVAAVHGDDLLSQLDLLLAAGHSFANLDSGAAFGGIRDRVVSANAYLGAQPIASALQEGVSIVITGRVADASLTVGPAMHEFGWKWNDWNRLSAATVAGHLIECGAQVTGGLWCNWQQVAEYANIGYPIAELRSDGDCIITKPAGSGGAVNRETVIEQLLYEVGDPARYLTPDVVADFTSVEIAEKGEDAVHIGTARGLAATDTLKVSIAYRDGFSASGMLVIAGPNARAKAELCGRTLLERIKLGGFNLERWNIECLGSGDSLPGVLPVCDAPEVVLRVSVHDSRRAAVERFAKEFAPLVTSGPPGVTGYTTGRPNVREVFAYWPALIAKSAVQAKVELLP